MSKRWSSFAEAVVQPAKTTAAKNDFMVARIIRDMNHPTHEIHASNLPIMRGMIRLYSAETRTNRSAPRPDQRSLPYSAALAGALAAGAAVSVFGADSDLVALVSALAPSL